MEGKTDIQLNMERKRATDEKMCVNKELNDWSDDRENVHMFIHVCVSMNIYVFVIVKY